MRALSRVAPRVAVFRIYAEIPHDTHDLIPRVFPVLRCEVAVAKAPADRVVASEHHLRERLVHDDGPGAWQQIAGVKRTAGEDRRVQHVEEVQSDRRRRHSTRGRHSGLRARRFPRRRRFDATGDPSMAARWRP